MSKNGSSYTGISMKATTTVDGTGAVPHNKPKDACEDSPYEDVSTGLLLDVKETMTNGHKAKSIFISNDCDNPEIREGKPMFDKTDVVFEQEKVKPLLYRISQTPPAYMLILSALQQALLAISSPLSVAVLVSEVVCGQHDDALKIEILSASFFMSGLGTIAMSTFGVRLPIFQGPAGSYLIPLLAMSTLPEWKCPETFTGVNPVDNSTVLLVTIDNGTVITARELILTKISGLSGSLVMAGGIHFLIGATGLVGVLLRFVGPVTIVPAIVLIGLFIYKMTVTLCKANWPVACFTAAVNFILSLYLQHKQSPMPFWTRQRGFHIVWFPFHQAFSVLLSIVCGWALSAVLTVAGALTDDPTSVHYLARTDARTHVIEETSWFIFPYPGKLGPLSFSAAGFISFFVATITSILDSIGDYSACARAVRASPPPKYAFNRGITVEGLMCMLSGSLGCCHPTLSFGSNIGAINLTGVASRRVFQFCGLIYIIFAVVGKFGAVFVTIPYSVLGGSAFVTNGIFVGLVLSYLQFVDLNSTRNLAIIGTSLLLGMMMPYWIEKNPNAIDTGNLDVNNVLQVLLTNPSFVGGCFACFMDNTIPGTMKERGLVNQMKEFDDEEAKLLAASYEDGEEVYRLPFVPESFRKSKLSKYIPIFEYTGK